MLTALWFIDSST